MVPPHDILEFWIVIDCVSVMMSFPLNVAFSQRIEVPPAHVVILAACTEKEESKTTNAIRTMNCFMDHFENSFVSGENICRMISANFPKNPFSCGCIGCADSSTAGSCGFVVINVACSGEYAV